MRGLCLLVGVYFMSSSSAVGQIMPTTSVDFWLAPCKQEINKLAYVTAVSLKVFLTNFKNEQQSMILLSSYCQVSQGERKTKQFINVLFSNSTDPYCQSVK